jgi:RNA polymerase sigma factor (sigma-70 family)
VAHDVWDPDVTTDASSRELLARARGGDRSALDRLFRRAFTFLRRWARGRLPAYARAVNDTVDIVQDVLMQTFRRLDKFEDRGKGALRAFLRTAVEHRIQDELRRVGRRPTDYLDDQLSVVVDPNASPFDAAVDAEAQERFRTALVTLSKREQILVVASLRNGLTYEQIALITGRPTPESARQAVRRAVVKLAQRMARVTQKPD